MFESLRLKTTAGAGGVGIGGPSRPVGGLVALPGSHLMHPSGYKLT